MTQITFTKLKVGDLLFYKGGNNKVSLKPHKLYSICNLFEYYVDIKNSKILERISKEDILNYFEYFEPDTEITKDDRVEHPSHYTWLKDKCGIEVLDITRHMNFNLGNAIKYILRSGHKREEGISDKQKQIEDLKKAIFYINDEIKRLE